MSYPPMTMPMASSAWEARGQWPLASQLAGGAGSPPAEALSADGGLPNPSAPSNAPGAPAGHAHQGARLQALGVQGPQPNLLQSLLMPGFGAPPRAPVAGLMGLPNTQIGGDIAAQGPAVGQASLEQQAFLFHLLAAQHQVLTAQAGQLAGVALSAPPPQAGMVPQFQAEQSLAPGAVPGAPPAHAAGEPSNPALFREEGQPVLLPLGARGQQRAVGRLELVFPRRGRKSGDSEKKVQDPVLITLEIVQRLFHLPLTEAARQLGLSPTAIKGACRRLGIKKWPFRAVTAKSHRRPPKKAAVEPSAPETDGLNLLGAAIEMDIRNGSALTQQAAPGGVGNQFWPV